ncbi:unnamed protein product [Didymodactylos carnosus]|uniref:Reverse transcriptase domain-containing protein n=1 Tax=Didymodactylos carnosus TaxID=1234261 RepID=A0A815LNA1_9BILA|nr:unnamed protein product [Didymodactylos carnosus]CAF4298408.1 unnamed protein product [Didymodactylos carnosus]
MLKLLYTNTKAQVRIDGDFSQTFDIETCVQEGGIPSPVLFNLLFDFIMRKILAEVGVSGVKLAYGNGDFYHSTREAHEDIEILYLIYADDVVAMCTTAADLEKFIRTFEKVTQECGLTMSVKKTCIMSLKQLKEDASRKVIKDQEVDNVKIDITIRNQTVDIVEYFAYLGCFATRDHSQEKEIETRITKASGAFNMLRMPIWYRKTVSCEAKMRIFRACILPVRGSVGVKCGL